MSNRKIVHYRDNNISTRIMEYGFLFFEFAGHTLLSFSDLVVTLPESSLRITSSTTTKTHYTISVDSSITSTSNSNSNTTNNNITTSTPTPYTNNIISTPSSVLLNKSDNQSSTTSILSTGQFTTPTTTTQPAQSNEKVKNLECELSRLREEIARIMANNSNAAATNVQPVMAAGGPPPPPPPVPPVFKPANLALKKLKSNGTESPAPMTPTKQSSMSIGDILRSGQKVTLKKSDVVRSPGGTPVRDVTNQQPISTQDFIANALKKKFSNIRVDDSPEVKRPKSSLKKTNDDSFFSDSDNDFDDQENVQTYI
ncbi:hypothetical protein PPL_02685 [Heterostelium album PN500]|uniref:Uncharacterized protein n=1 Tax=Heterostelium pallidum (strain ATCC 26659 / Pp 5 / PN500) TaxID=670386 RepID=D3B2S1_HETP5|nr:hypothetical protein PPL_02685 [Heterostelium album PN500]EFA83619.1 hypothetical protein PPL_02685 [Heterostelium album PN500]|eukprot:XP_020435736.1 hypothetical protein PPL_02685 [Heterostelium album PN500]